MTTYLYVALAGDDKLSIFTLASDTGVLTHQRDVPQADQPSPLAVDPAKQFCFVDLRMRWRERGKKWLCFSYIPT